MGSITTIRSMATRTVSRKLSTAHSCSLPRCRWQSPRQRIGLFRSPYIHGSAGLLCSARSSSQCSKHKTAPAPPSPWALDFWKSESTWRRASINTFRCLVGCTSGDFAAMWFLQAHYPDLGVGPIMAISSETLFGTPYDLISRC